jgi:hypothetical protein
MLVGILNFEAFIRPSASDLLEITILGHTSVTSSSLRNLELIPYCCLYLKSKFQGLSTAPIVDA